MVGLASNESVRRCFPTMARLVRYFACLAITGFFGLHWLLPYYYDRHPLLEDFSIGAWILPFLRIEVHKDITVRVWYEFTPDADAAGPGTGFRWRGFWVSIKNLEVAPRWHAHREFGVPAWVLAAFFAFLSYRWREQMPHPIRNRRRSRGLCEFCGYDLRATPDRCPECGCDHLAEKPSELENGASAIPRKRETGQAQ